MGTITVNFKFEQLTVEQYNKILAESEPQRKANYPGLLFHVAAADGNGMFVCDIWESEEHFNAFGQMMIPLLIKAGGVPAKPVIYPVYNVINELK